MKIIKSLVPLLILITLSCYSGEKNKPKWDNAVYMSKSIEKIYEASPEKVFSYYCPVKEYEYMRKWTCTMRYSKSGYAEKNAIFQSTYPWPFGLKATWICTKYEPNEAVTYTVFIPNTLILLVEHSFEKLPDNNTKNTVVLSGFGLNWLGKIIVNKMFNSLKEQKNATEFFEELDYYLKNNRKMPK